MKRLITAILLLCMCVFLSACGCEECSSTGKIDCAVCSNGYIYCEGCSSGIKKRDCSDCSYGKNYIECDGCEGKGFFMNPLTWQTFQCPRCDGMRHYYEECNRCDGEGFFEERCSTCEGDYKEKCLSCNNGYLPCPDCTTEQ